MTKIFTEENKAILKRQLKRLPWLILIAVGLALPALAAKYPALVEQVYSRGMYPAVSTALGHVTSLAPFSVAEFFVYAVIGGLLISLVSTIIQVIKRKAPWAKLVAFAVSTAILAGAMLTQFYLVWGLNYYRPTLYQLMALPVRERGSDELFTLCLQLSDEANSLRETLPEDESGVFAPKESFAETAKAICAAYDSLGQRDVLFSVPVYPAKPVLASRAMSVSGISGIYMPFTGEANVNVHQSPLLKASSAAHENAHFLGFAREDEANFISCLACSYSSDPSVRYSGVMLALIHCGNALFDVDTEKYKELYQTYGEGMRRDLHAYNEYWNGFDGKIEDAVNDLNDNYLKFNGQSDGVNSYGMMVDLLLAYYIQ